MKTVRSMMRRAVLAGVALVGLATLCGCDYALLGGYDPIFGYANYPSYGLYDPTADIQSAVSYRQDVFDSVNQGWDDYILQ